MVSILILVVYAANTVVAQDQHTTMVQVLVTALLVGMDKTVKFQFNVTVSTLTILHRVLVQVKVHALTVVVTLVYANARQTILEMLAKHHSNVTE
jgi:DMSO reductase anchor subunit